MNDAVLDPIRHNLWATEQLVQFCSKLDPDQEQTGAEGTYGSILATLGHLVRADAAYLWRLRGGEGERWGDRAAEVAHVGELGPIVERTSELWEDFLSRPFDPAPMIQGEDADGLRFEVRAGVLVAQTVNHGNEHRSQVFTVLTSIGIEPPDLDGWSWGLATGGFRELGRG